MIDNHQLYVSYADADEEWAIHFVNNLKACLRKQLGEIDDNFIWAKYMQRGIGNKQDIRQRHLSASKYLLMILSPAYLKTIGNSEIELFGRIDNVIPVEHNSYLIAINFGMKMIGVESTHWQLPTSSMIA